MRKEKDEFVLVVTGGHATPALALIGEIRRKYPWAKIFYFGSKYSFEGKRAFSFEYQTVRKMKGIHFIPLTTGRLQRRFSLYTIPSLFKIPWGFFQAFLNLRKIRPKLIVSFGGYLSVPVVVMGWFLGIPSLVHEQTRTVGLANKINFLFAKTVALAFPIRMRGLAKKKAVVTGNLIREELQEYRHPGRLKKLEEKGKKTPRPLLYITGGKSGSVFVNHLIEKLLPVWKDKYFIVHQTGELEKNYFLRLKKSLPPRYRQFYYPFSFLKGEEVGWLLHHADLVISRAGANTVYELAFFHCPAILIPIPWSYQNEQNKNALWLKRKGGGEVLSQNRATPQKLNSLVEKMLSQKEVYKASLAKQKVKDGKKLLFQEVEKILQE